MARAVLVYILFVFLPAAALAVFAFRVADWDRAERVEALRTDLRDEARALGKRIEGAIRDAAKKAEEDSHAGFARDGCWIGYSPDSEPEETAEKEIPAEEMRFYALSVRGGESYELLRKNPPRAIDAYSFYLSRIRSPALRGRLKFRMARAALSAGGERNPERLLGGRLLLALFDEGRGLRTEEGLPIDLLAMSRFFDLAPEEGRTFQEKAQERLEAAAPRLPTPILDRLAKVIGPEDRGLLETVRKRTLLEAAVRSHPEILTSREAVLDESYLLIARVHEEKDSRGSPVRAIRLAAIDLPPLDSERYSARLDHGTSVLPAEPQSGGRIVHPIRQEENRPLLATLTLEDPRHGEKLSAIDRRLALSRALVALLVIVTLAGGVALVRYLSKERHLAMLRSKLVRNVSHELKTPVTSIRMLAEMLSEDRLEPSKARRFLDLLRSESLRLSGLVENLLDLSRLGRKEEVLSLEPVDLEALLRRIAEGFAFRAEEKKVDFRAEGLGTGDGGSPAAVVTTNAQALERIVLNLLDNALKYGRGERPEIRLALSLENGAARISVTDNGPGIPKRDRERVFEEFYRLNFEDYGVKGSGLGLSIARRLARKLGGDVALESGPGKGSRFTLELPLEVPCGEDPHR